MRTPVSLPFQVPNIGLRVEDAAHVPFSLGPTFGRGYPKPSCSDVGLLHLAGLLGHPDGFREPPATALSRGASDIGPWGFSFKSFQVFKLRDSGLGIIGYESQWSR